MLYSSLGIEPVIVLPTALRYVSWDRKPIWDGNEPRRAVLSKVSEEMKQGGTIEEEEGVELEVDEEEVLLHKIPCQPEQGV